MRPYDLNQTTVQQKSNKLFGMVTEGMKNKLMQESSRLLEKGIERMRAKTPDNATREAYKDVLEGGLLVDYLKA